MGKMKESYTFFPQLSDVSKFWQKMRKFYNFGADVWDDQSYVFASIFSLNSKHWILIQFKEILKSQKFVNFFTFLDLVFHDYSPVKRGSFTLLFLIQAHFHDHLKFFIIYYLF